MLNIGIIGIGNCGNQIAKLAVEQLGCPAFAINTSEDDLATLPAGIPKKCIGDSQGSGKSREEAKKFLEKSIMELIRSEEFMSFVTEQEVILLVSSTGGGTGSGTVPIMTQIIKDTYKDADGIPIITIPIGVMPKFSEGKSTQVNTLGFMHELWDVLENPTYMLFDNDTFRKQTSYKVLEEVNKNVIAAIEVMQCKYNTLTPYDSIDPKDMKTILRTPGRLFIEVLKNIKEKDLDEADLEDLMIQKIKTSAQAEMQRDGNVFRTGVITNLSPKLNDMFDSHINKIRAFIGEPVEEFLHITVNAEKELENSLVLIMAGLSKCVDRVDKVRDRIAEIDAQNAAAEKSDVAISADEINEMDRARKKANSSASLSNEVDLKSIFGKFK